MSTIFIVEDEALVAIEIEDLVRSIGHEVVGKAASGEDACRMVEKLKPDLVLMDIVLRGDMDGVEAGRIIQDDMDIPVVFVSAHPGQVERVKELRPYGFVVKPFEEDQIRASIALALEERHAERLTSSNEKEMEEYFQTLLEGAKNAILLLDTELGIKQLNKSAGELFGLPHKEMVGMECCGLLFGRSSRRVEAIINRLEENQGWIGEVECVDAEGREFPGEVTIRRITSKHAYCLLIIRDMSKEKALEENLVKEKNRAEHMGITLKTVMEAVDEDKKEVLEALSRRISRDIYPALERMAREQSREVRDSYKNVILSELNNIFSGSGVAHDNRLIALTPTELKVCRYIQAGRTTKEIAEMMHSAFDTIQTHRKNIRKKLGLKGKKTTIFNFLQTVGQIETE